MTRDEYVEIINQHIIRKYAYRDRKVLIDHLVDGYTIERTAERNNLSRSQVIRIVEKRIPQIKKYIE